MGVEWDISSVVYRLKERPWFGKEILYNIHIESGVPIELVRLINMSLHKTCTEVHICLMHFLFRMVWNKEILFHHCFSSWEKLEVNGTCQLVYAADANVLGENINIVNTDALLQICLKVNAKCGYLVTKIHDKII